MFYSICVESMYFVSTHLVLYLLLSHHLSSFIVYHHLAKTRASSRADPITYKRQEYRNSSLWLGFLRLYVSTYSLHQLDQLGAANMPNV